MTPFVPGSRSELQEELNRLYSRQRHLEWQIFVVSADWERQRLRSELAQTKKEVAEVQGRLNALSHQSNPWVSLPRPRPVAPLRPRPVAAAQVQQRRKLLMLASLIGCALIFFNLLQAVVANGGFHHNDKWGTVSYPSGRSYPEGNKWANNPPAPPLRAPAYPLVNPKIDGFDQAHRLADITQARRLGDSEQVISIGEQILTNYNNNLNNAPDEVKGIYSDLIAAYRERADYFLTTGSSARAVQYYNRLITLDNYYSGATTSVRGEDYYHYGLALEATYQVSTAKAVYQTAADLGEPDAQAALDRIERS